MDPENDGLEQQADQASDAEASTGTTDGYWGFDLAAEADQAIARAEAAAADEDDDGEPVEAQPPVETAPPAPVEDEVALAARLAEKGYKVEAPPPPPNPLDSLYAELAPHIGHEELERQQQILLQPLPPKPSPDDDPYDDEAEARRKAYDEAIRAQDTARATITRLNENRSLANKVYAWARTQALAGHGEDMLALPEKYGIDAKLVEAPDSLAPLFEAVASAVAARKDAEWQQKLDQLDAGYKRRLAQGRVDGAVARHREIASAPAAVVPGGRGSANPFSIPVGADGLVTDEWIEQAKQGRFAGVPLA